MLKAEMVASAAIWWKMQFFHMRNEFTVRTAILLSMTLFYTLMTFIFQEKQSRKK